MQIDFKKDLTHLHDKLSCISTLDKQCYYVRTHFFQTTKQVVLTMPHIQLMQQIHIPKTHKT